jgi:GNAT superfamily N-acetyltransferase
MTLAPEEVWRRQVDFIRGYIGWLASASPGAQLWEVSGVRAAIVPAAATRSVPNSVITESVELLAESYDQLAQAYREAGVDAWTVWLHENDSPSRELLEAKGHVFDGAPVAMALELSEWQPEELGDLDWDAAASFDELGQINDLAYGYDPPGMAPAIAAPKAGTGIRLYRARSDGEVGSVLGMLDEGDDSGVIFVATLPEMRGRGLASRLLTAALLEARERGMRTSSLQASALGSPIYGRLGYRAHFRFNNMERRG